jgi:hypothetical protein
MTIIGFDMYPQLFLRAAVIMLFQPYLLVVRSSNTSGYVKKLEDFQTRREYVAMSDNSAQALTLKISRLSKAKYEIMLPQAGTLGGLRSNVEPQKVSLHN